MAIQGAIRVQFGDVFPHGAFAVAVEAVRDFDKSTRERPVQARDKESGVPVWAVEVLDADPEARAAERSVKVKIAADHEPVMPDLMAGTPFRPVVPTPLVMSEPPEGSNEWIILSWRRYQNYLANPPA